jgi:hypothetical protein
MGIDNLPPELIVLILSFVPVLDYLYVKLAGSRYLTNVIRTAVPVYLAAIISRP